MSETRICPFCGKETDKFIMFRGDIVGCRYCGISKKQTNADRIRAMTDEELAEFLLNRDLDVIERASKAVWFTYKINRESSLANVIDWLRQEATDE